MRLFGGRQARDTQTSGDAERQRRAAEAERSGLRCLKDGDLLQAEAELRRCVEFSPDYALGHGYLGLTLYRQGRLGEALAELQVAIALMPTDEVLQRTCGMILEALDRAEEAGAAYRAAIQINPQSARAHAALGSLALKRGDLAAAEQHVSAALQLDQQDPQALAELAEIRHKSGNLSSAIEAIRAALGLRPTSAPYRFKLGIFLEEAGQLDGAEAALITAHEGLPTDADVLQALGRVLMKTGKEEQVLPLYERAMKADPDSHERYEGDLYRLVVEHSSTAGAQQPAGGLAGATPVVSTPRPSAPRQAPVPESILTAIANLEASLISEPDNSRIHRDLSIQYLRAGRIEEAKDHARLAELLRSQTGRHQTAG